MKIKRILAVALAAASLFAMAFIQTEATGGNSGAFVPTPDDSLLLAPASGEIRDYPGGTYDADPEETINGTPITEWGNYRAVTNRTYNFNRTSMFLNNVNFIDGDVIVAYGNSLYTWSDSPNYYAFTFSEDGKVTLQRGQDKNSTWNANLVIETFTGFDFSSGAIEYSILLDGDKYVITINGRTIEVAASVFSGLSNPASCNIAFGFTLLGTSSSDFAPGATYNIRSISGFTNIAAVSGYTVAKPSNLIPTPAGAKTIPGLADITIPPWVGANITKALNPGGNGVDMVIYGGGRRSYATQRYSMSNVSIILNNVEIAAGSKIVLGFTTTVDGSATGPGLYVVFGSDGLITFTYGTTTGMPSPFITFSGSDFLTSKTIELRMTLTNNVYTMNINGADIKFEASMLDYAKSNIGSGAASFLLDPEDVSVSFQQFSYTGDNSFTVASIGPARADFDEKYNNNTVAAGILLAPRADGQGLRFLSTIDTAFIDDPNVAEYGTMILASSQAAGYSSKALDLAMAAGNESLFNNKLAKVKCNTEYAVDGSTKYYSVLITGLTKPQADVDVFARTYVELANGEIFYGKVVKTNAKEVYWNYVAAGQPDGTVTDAAEWFGTQP